MAPRNLDRLDADERLLGSEETSAAVDWPVALHHRLDQLVQLAEENGDRTTRKELLAAIVLAVSPSGQRLSKLLRDYRKARVRDAILNTPQGENVIEIQRRGPGRPRVRRISG